MVVGAGPSAGSSAVRRRGWVPHRRPPSFLLDCASSPCALNLARKNTIVTIQHGGSGSARYSRRRRRRRTAGLYYAIFHVTPPRCPDPALSPADLAPRETAGPGWVGRGGRGHGREAAEEGRADSAGLGRTGLSPADLAPRETAGPGRVGRGGRGHAREAAEEGRAGSAGLGRTGLCILVCDIR